MSESGKNEILRLDVSGKDPEMWVKLRRRLVEIVHQVLDTVIDVQTGGTLKSEGQDAVSAMLDNFKARLKKAGMENEKIQAEITALYSKCEQTAAEARKTRAEAAAIEFDTAVKRLKTALGFSRALAIATDDEDAVIFSAQVDAMLETIEQFSGSPKGIEKR